MMKKITLFISIFLLLISGNVWGQTNFTFTLASINNGTSVTTKTYTAVNNTYISADGKFTNSGLSHTATDNAAYANWQGWDDQTRFFYYAFTVKTGYKVVVGQINSNLRSSNTGPRVFQVQWSKDLTDWTTVATSNLTNANDTNVNSSSGLNITVNAGETLYVRYKNNSTVSSNGNTVASTGTGRLNSGSISGTYQVTTPSEPTITLDPATTLSLGTTICEGSRGTGSYTVTGSSLTADIELTPTAQIEISTTSDFATAYNSTSNPKLKLSPSSGSVNQIIYVRSVTTLPAAAFTGSISHTSTDATTVTKNISGTVIAPQTPTISIAQSSGATSPMCGSQSITFTATTNNLGGGTASLQWKRNGNNVGTGVTYTLSTPADNDVITCEITNITNGCVTSTTANSNTITLTVNSLPASPTGLQSDSPKCLPGGVTISYLDSVPAGVTWYWQGTNTNGTATTNSDANYNATSSGTYHLRARNNTTGCWSASVGIAVVINSQLSGVSSTPSPTNNNTNVCYSGEGAVNAISWSSVSGATSYDVYFGAGSLPGTLTTNVATNSYNVGTLLASTTYYWKVVPRNGCGETTGTPITWSFTTRAEMCVCVPSTTNVPGDRINYFEIEGITSFTYTSNATSSGGYGNLYNTHSVSQAAGNTLTFAETYVTNLGAAEDHGFNIWVDWNGNGVFTDSGEKIFVGGSITNAGFINNFTIPPTTPVGNYRMRIRAQYNTADPASCGNISWGEALDFKLTVTSPCVAPSNQPTNFTSSSIAQNTATIGWSNPANDNILVIARLGGAVNAAPVNGTNYTGNAAFGNGTQIGTGNYVVYKGTGNSVGLSGLSSSTQYHFVLYKYNTTDTCHNLTNPLTGNFTTLAPPAATLPYTENFEGTNNWYFVNGSQTNKWFIGTATQNGGTKSLYISNDNGVSNAYTLVTAANNVVQAYREIVVPAGSTTAQLSFDWKSFGEGFTSPNYYDYFRVWLVPVSYTPTAGTQITSGSGRIQVGTYFNNQQTFTTYNNNTVNISSFAGNTMRLVFEWRNDTSLGNQPPAAIDNINIVLPVPTITISETSLSGFTYQQGQGPSATQPFVVNGSNLEEDITVTASANWEISTNLDYDGTNVSPWSTIPLPKNASNGVTNKTIHVRLKAGLPLGTYTGTVTLTSLNAVTKIVNLNGEVTPAIPVMGITGAGSAIANGSTTPYGFNNTQFASQNIGESQVKTYVIKNSGGAPLTIGEITIYGTGVSAFAVQNAPVLGTIVNPNQTIQFNIKFAPTTINLKEATVSIENDDPNKNPYTFAINGNATYCSSVGETIIVAKQDFEESPASPVLGYATTNISTPGPNTGFSTGTSGNNSKPVNNNLFSEGARGYRIQGSDEAGITTSGVIFTFDGVDTSNHTGINLSFRVAGFSTESTTNGMDHLGTSGGGENDGVPNDQKVDFVLVEVSPDNGATWYQQAKIVSNELNLAWSFNSAGTISGARDYAADNNLTYFGSTSAAQYSTIAINNLPQVSQLKVRITAQDNAVKESWVLDDIRITSTGLIPKTWNGTQWLPSAPIKSDKAIINGDYNSGTHGSFKVCQCEIKSEKKLTVAANHEITVTDFMINNGEVIVENDANFIQTNEAGSNTGSGTITVKRQSQMKRLDYTYWSSPVANQQLKAFSPNTQQARFYEYHENDDLFYTTSWLNDFVPAKGYAIRAFNNYSPATAEFTFLGEFKGTPNNRPKNFPLSYTPTTLPDNPTHVEPGYNLTGNPYPSNIDFDHLVDSNIDSSTNKSLIYKNAWFWTNTNLNLSGNLGSAYNGDNYAIYTGSGGLAAPHTYSSGQFGTSQTPTRYIKVGQGFMIKARALTSHGKNLVFSNSVRTSQDAGFFPKKGNASEEVDRFWLRLITPANNVYSLLVAYIEGATNDFEGDYDAKRMGTPSDDFYTVLNNEKYAIQGRQYPLEITDVVALGNKFFETGQYSIGIEKKEGIFDNGQNIYLKDKETGILTNLSQGIYTFTANKGESTGRFEIVYQSATLSTNTQQKDDLHVYRDGNNFVIKSGHKKITGLEVYDSSGRLVYTTKSNSTEVILHSEKLNNGMYILKINRGEEVTSKKIIK